MTILKLHSPGQTDDEGECKATKQYPTQPGDGGDGGNRHQVKQALLSKLHAHMQRREMIVLITLGGVI